MKIYVLVHVYDHAERGITDGGMLGTAVFTSRSEALDEMYRQLDNTWGQMDQDIYNSTYNEDLSYAWIRHYEEHWVYDHEWRIIEL